ncbi:hypothetical protein ACFQ0M_20190 [Kitasatospora aburaviensis]
MQQDRQDTGPYRLDPATGIPAQRRRQATPSRSSSPHRRRSPPPGPRTPADGRPAAGRTPGAAAGGR